MGGIGGSSPEHVYEKLNYELMVDNSKKTDPRLNSLGRWFTQLYIDHQNGNRGLTCVLK